jgi:hypothetical protein
MLKSTAVLLTGPKDPATTWTIPGPSVAEHVPTTGLPLIHTSAVTPKVAVLTLTMVGLIMLLSACTLMSKVLYASEPCAMTFTVSLDPGDPPKVGAVDGQEVEAAVAMQTTPVAAWTGMPGATNSAAMSSRGSDFSAFVFFNLIAPFYSRSYSRLRI